MKTQEWQDGDQAQNCKLQGGGSVGKGTITAVSSRQASCGVGAACTQTPHARRRACFPRLISANGAYSSLTLSGAAGQGCARPGSTPGTWQDDSSEKDSSASGARYLKPTSRSSAFNMAEMK